METISLNNELSKIKIDIATADIAIYRSTTQTPQLIINPNFFEVKNKKKSLLIKSKKQTPKKAFVSTGNFFNGISIGIGSSVVQINDTTIINGEIYENNQDTKVELFLNPDTIYQLNANITSGNISIDDLRFSDLMIDTTNGEVSLSEIDALNVYVNSVSGDVSLRNIDILDTLIKSVSGDIDIDVAESETNYSVNVSSVCGCVRQTSTEVKTPTTSNTKRKIKVKQVSGDTRINFKGKRQ